MLKVTMTIETADESYVVDATVPEIVDGPSAEKALEAIEQIKTGMKLFYKVNEVVMNASESELGLDHFWQGDDGTVYKTERPEWKSVKMEHFMVSRTRFPHEKKGSLSMVAAREAGFEVEGK